jgi:UDP-4-amino-4-deoxy-L-arabinose formyltransferase/UDP-glucuronic acid dehydrogenase (UDP-4-keto-hexauronic acid decarboxylating)
MGCLGFDALLRHGFHVAAVFTHRDDPHEEVWWASLAERAAARSVPVHHPEKTELKTDAFAELVAGYRPEFIFSFYFRWMIPTRVLALAPRGAFNLHGSLLPHYRGRAPVNWVLVNGERETGVSLHTMVAKADAGDLVDQERVPIARADTAFTLYGKLERAADTLLDRALPGLRDGTAVVLPMDLAHGTYCGGRTPADGRIEWGWSAERIYNLVRAVTHPYPGAFTEMGAGELLVWWAVPADRASAAAPGTVLDVSADGITVATGDGTLRLVTVQLRGEPELPASAFALVHAISPGIVLGGVSDPGPLTPDPVSSSTGHRPPATGHVASVSGHRPPATGHVSASENGDPT